MNERLSSIQQMKRKHKANSLSELIEIENKIQNRIEHLSNLSKNLEKLQKELKLTETELLVIAQKLSNYRSLSAQELSKNVSSELINLGMSGAEFSIDCVQSQNINTQGLDKIEFLLKSNPGDIPRSLNKVASGGELSRIMLLLKCLLGNNDMTMIFDEIDAGTSGRVSQMIGQKLKQLAQRQQVICVTHQPIVASYADSHFVVQKMQYTDETILNLIELKDKEQRIEALINLISGEKEGIKARDYAEDLLIQAQKIS